VFTLKLVRSTGIVILLLAQGIAYGNIIGRAEVENLYGQVKSSLDRSATMEPYYLESENNKKMDSGEAAYYLPLGFEEIAQSLSSVKNWCEVMSLHINVKACTYNEINNSITVYMGRKYYQPPEKAYALTYDFSTIHKDGYFAAIAIAKDGPMGTSNYHIEVEIIEIENKSFGRIYVSNRRSLASSIGMKLYLATTGRNKQGIRVIGHDDQGNQVYSKGESAVAERNLLRYYFAFVTFFKKIDANNPDQRHAAQLTYWFDQIERYPQLNEMSREDYIASKTKERINQNSLQQQFEEY
jgi:hypothetical protein